MSLPAKIFAVSLRLAFAATSASAPLVFPNLSGTWRLNRNVSDDPAKVARETRPSDSGGSTSGAWSGRRGHRRGDAGRSREDPDPDMFAALETLTIRHQEPQLSITDDVGRQRTLFTDGRRTEEGRSRGGTTKVTARWKEGHIEVVSVPEHGPKITETYAMTADGTQLTVTTKLEGARRSGVTIRRVYDAARPPAAAPAPTPAPSTESAEDEEIGIAP